MLKAAGHEVVLLRERLAADAPDPLVAAVSEMSEAILVSMDGDFREIAPRAGIGRRRFQRLSRIGLKCPEPQAAKRLEAALSLVEHEWNRSQAMRDRRTIVEVMNSVIRTIR